MKSPQEFAQEVLQKKEQEKAEAKKAKKRAEERAKKYVKGTLPAVYAMKLAEIEKEIRKLFHYNEEYNRQFNSHTFSVEHNHPIITNAWRKLLQQDLEPKGYKVESSWKTVFIQVADEDPGRNVLYDVYTISW